MSGDEPEHSGGVDVGGDGHEGPGLVRHDGAPPVVARAGDVDALRRPRRQRRVGDEGHRERIVDDASVEHLVAPVKVGVEAKRVGPEAGALVGDAGRGQRLDGAPRHGDAARDVERHESQVEPGVHHACRGLRVGPPVELAVARLRPAHGECAAHDVHGPEPCAELRLGGERARQVGERPEHAERERRVMDRRVDEEADGAIRLAVRRLAGGDVAESFGAVGLARRPGRPLERRVRSGHDGRAQPGPSGHLARIAQRAIGLDVPVHGRDPDHAQRVQSRRERDRDGIIDARIRIDERGDWHSSGTRDSALGSGNGRARNVRYKSRIPQLPRFHPLG